MRAAGVIGPWSQRSAVGGFAFYFGCVGRHCTHALSPLRSDPMPFQPPGRRLLREVLSGSIMEKGVGVCERVGCCRVSKARNSRSSAVRGARVGIPGIAKLEQTYTAIGFDDVWQCVGRVSTITRPATDLLAYERTRVQACCGASAHGVKGVVAVGELS